MRCDGPSRHRQCGHSASCDDYRRTSTPRDVVCNTARLDTTHFTGRTHWVGHARRAAATEDTEKPRPKLRTMCCGRCHANRAAGPGASRDEIAAAAPRALVPRCAPLAPRQGRSSACGTLARSAAGRAHQNAPPLDVSAASKATDATSDMRDATVRRLDGSLRPQGQPRRPP